MDKPEDISVTAWEYGVKEAKFYADWLHAGNSSGEISEHAISGLADSFARLYAFAQERAYEDAARIAEKHGEKWGADGVEGWIVARDIEEDILQRKEEIGRD